MSASYDALARFILFLLYPTYNNGFICVILCLGETSPTPPHYGPDRHAPDKVGDDSKMAPALRKPYFPNFPSMLSDESSNPCAIVHGKAALYLNKSLSRHAEM